MRSTNHEVNVVRNRTVGCGGSCYYGDCDLSFFVKLDLAGEAVWRIQSIGKPHSCLPLLLSFNPERFCSVLSLFCFFFYRMCIALPARNCRFFFLFYSNTQSLHTCQQNSCSFFPVGRRASPVKAHQCFHCFLFAAGTLPGVVSYRSGFGNCPE